MGNLNLRTLAWLSSVISKVSLVALLSVVLGACMAGSLERSRGAGQPNAGPEGEFLDGSAPLTDASRWDLASTDRPLLLIFAQETCVVCIAETRGFIESYAEVSAQTEILTVLVGAIREDAQDWKELFEVPWNVGFDPELELFRRYCPGGQTPCSLLQIPGRGIVLRHTGLLSPNDVKPYLKSPEEK